MYTLLLLIINCRRKNNNLNCALIRIYKLICFLYIGIHISSWAAYDHILVEIENLEDYQSDKEDSNLDRAIDQCFCITGRMVKSQH